MAHISDLVDGTRIAMHTCFLSPHIFMFFKSHEDLFSKREYTITEIVFYNFNSSSSGKLR
jgi:hypothetical protein